MKMRSFFLKCEISATSDKKTAFTKRVRFKVNCPESGRSRENGRSWTQQEYNRSAVDGFRAGSEGPLRNKPIDQLKVNGLKARRLIDLPFSTLNVHFISVRKLIIWESQHFSNQSLWLFRNHSRTRCMLKEGNYLLSFTLKVNLVWMTSDFGFFIMDFS